jgi:hydroxylamine reductase
MENIVMAKITKDTLIADCLKLNPNSAEILMSVGMHCLGCAMSHGETIEEAVFVHGNDLDALLEKLNEGVKE